ncbi:RNase J family beta-CASP ribonuclease [Candidatus Woesearchaeota archaeon]|nr:RNase J family beta-CASP ribonuclease [Candidatus Woesearchaeota archaeon]
MNIYAVGGYDQIGGNMTVVEVGEEAVVLDMGLYLEPYIQYTDDLEFEQVKIEDLKKIGAVPDDSIILPIKKKIKAIVPSHAHLDHVGAIVWMSNQYDCPIICTPFTAEVIKAIAKDEKITLKNPVKSVPSNGTYKLTNKITLEFVHVTHSTPHTAMVCIHTPEGRVMYANDFKLDNSPVLGKKPNYERFKQLGEEGIKALICDSTRALTLGKTPSEQVAKEMLKDVMLGTDSSGKAIVFTTFSSHIARLKSAVEFAQQIGRKVVILGRSLGKYIEAAENVHLVDFSKTCEIVRYGKHIRRKLQEIQRSPEKYVMIVTGHQAEPKATLSKIARRELQFRFSKEDHIIFSCGVIPTAINQENRHKLEEDLKEMGVRIFKDIHVSGHAAKEDLRDLLTLLKPKHLIPAHGELDMRMALANLAVERGYRMDKNIHILHNGGHLQLR